MYLAFGDCSAVIIPSEMDFVSDVQNHSPCSRLAANSFKSSYKKLEQVPGGARMPPAGTIS